MHEAALHSARIVWDYLQLKQDPVPADVIVVFGTNDLRVARFAARLYQDGFGHSLVCTGGMAHQGDLLATNWPKTEAEMYADEAVALGVPRDRILIEPRATPRRTSASPANCCAATAAAPVASCSPQSLLCSVASWQPWLSSGPRFPRLLPRNA